MTKRTESGASSSPNVSMQQIGEGNIQIGTAENIGPITFPPPGPRTDRITALMPEEPQTPEPKAGCKGSHDSPTPFPPTDLALCIRGDSDSPRRTLELTLSAEQPSSANELQAYGVDTQTLTLGSAVQLRLETMLERIGGNRVPLGSEGPVPAEVRDCGARLGAELLPEAYAQALWQLRGRGSSMLIDSSEATIPWEILRLRNPHGGPAGEDDGQFLCEAFATVRWLPPHRPPLQLPMTKMAVVVPSDEPSSDVQQELDFLRSLEGLGCSVSVLPSSCEVVRRTLDQGAYDAWHFCGHSSPPMEDAGQMQFKLKHGPNLTPEMLSSHHRSMLGKQPLVFMNSCHSARMGLSLTRNIGWSTAFLGIGAGAFVGSLWKVSRGQAVTYAGEFYQRLFAGQELATAIHGSRAAMKHSADASRLAYSVYGHPAARR